MSFQDTVLAAAMNAAEAATAKARAARAAGDVEQCGAHLAASDVMLDFAATLIRAAKGEHIALPRHDPDPLSHDLGSAPGG